jgi:glyoxylase-like metal-dependent hydrolase (beta-lactamase superfamily II)
MKEKSMIKNQNQNDLSRRKFLGKVGAATVASAVVPNTITSGENAPVPGDASNAFVKQPAVIVPLKRNGQMWPIKSGLKSKRIKFDVPQNQISWAYMKELREHNKTRKIYDINPYVEVYQFRDNLCGLFTENCDGMGDVWMYLVIGPEKAMLIDTAYGLGDLKGLVDKLTGGKPIIVVNTHEHYDHAYGNCRFEKVYCHEYLVPYLKNQNEHMWDYLFDAFGNNIWLEFDRKDLPKFKKYEIAGVPDGYKFNLGGDYEVELVFTGGHSAGHAAYIDKKDRILFSGDNICSDVSSCGSVNIPRPGPYGENTTLKAYRDNVKRLVDRMDEYDYIFPMHFMNNIENNLMPKILEACDAILANPEKCDYATETWGKNAAEPSMRYYKFIKDFSVIAYGYKKA